MAASGISPIWRTAWPVAATKSLRPLRLAHPCALSFHPCRQRSIIELPMRNALSLRSGLKLSRLVRDQRIEIIHAHLARDYPLAALAAGRSGAQLVSDASRLISAE